jgi:hypothetical protein
MKKFFLIFSISFIAISFCYAQTEVSTLYNTGKPLTSCECNFENLFANWGADYVTNHDTIKFISYAFVETLSDSARILFYIEESVSLDTPLFGTKGRSYYEGEPGDLKKRMEYYVYPETLRPRFDSIPESKRELAKNEWNKMLKLNKEYALPLINIGDKVYVVKFKSGDKIYEKYVICNPKKNTIVFDHLFLGRQKMGEF